MNAGGPGGRYSAWCYDNLCLSVCAGFLALAQVQAITRASAGVNQWTVVLPNSVVLYISH